MSHDFRIVAVTQHASKVVLGVVTRLPPQISSSGGRPLRLARQLYDTEVILLFTS